MTIDAIRREIARALSGHRPAFRGVLTRWKHRSKGANLVQAEGFAGEKLRDAEYMQHAGFVSAPPPAAEYVAAPLGGKTVHTVIIATEFGQYKVELAEGEVAVHHITEPDCYIHMKAGRIIEVRCAQLSIVADTSITMTAPNITATASAGIELDTPTVHASNDIVAANDISDLDGEKSMRGMREIYDGHDHPENDDGGPTNEPNQKMGD